MGTLSSGSQADIFSLWLCARYFTSVVDTGAIVPALTVTPLLLLGSLAEKLGYAAKMVISSL